MLSSWDDYDQDLAMELRLHELNNHTRTLNVKLGHLENERDQEAAVRWDTAFYADQVTRVADMGGRMVERVELISKYTSIVDQYNRLHPCKGAVFTKVLDTVTYINGSPDGMKWRHHEFI